MEFNQGIYWQIKLTDFYIAFAFTIIGLVIWLIIRLIIKILDKDN